MPDDQLNLQTTALLFFDVLKGAGYVQTPGLVDNCVKVKAAARAANVPVFFAVGYHRPDLRDFRSTVVDADQNLSPYPDGPRARKPTSATLGTHESRVIDELAPTEEDFVVPKPRWSAFFGTVLESNLRALGIETLLIAGGSTDVGIASTVFAARDLDYNIVVLRDCCNSLRPGAQDFFMDRIFPRMGRVISADQAVALLSGRAG
jgi:nicotinamidase-related amidase